MDAELLPLLPKTQLHCHLEGTLLPERFIELARRHGVDISARGFDPARVYDFRDFGEFLLLFRDVCEALREPADYAQLAADYVHDAARQGVRYAELFVSPSVWTWFHRSIDVRETFVAIRRALDGECLRYGMDVALICDLTRNFGPERALDTARVALRMRDLGVIGVGLGGDEVRFPPEPFAGAFRLAREGGLRTVAHAGEAAGPQSVRAAIEVLGAERIGHGVRSVEDPGVVALLRDRRIPLEVCPTSNRRTAVIPPDVAHPIAELDAAGVFVTIDADDPALFRVSILGEYEIVARTLGMEAAIRFARNGIEASFAAEVKKQQLRRELESVLTGFSTAPSNM